MRKFEQLSSEVTLAILLGRETVKITKGDGPWYEVEATTISGRKLVGWFTLIPEGNVPDEVLDVVSVEDYNGETSHEHVREWLKNNVSAGVIYLQRYIHAYGMDDSEVFASFLGRECSE